MTPSSHRTRRDLTSIRKLAELPFDFVRKRVSVIVRPRGRSQLITKGAFHQVLEICTHTGDGRPLDAATEHTIARHYDAMEQPEASACLPSRRSLGATRAACGRETTRRGWRSQAS